MSGLDQSDAKRPLTGILDHRGSVVSLHSVCAETRCIERRALLRTRCAYGPKRSSVSFFFFLSFLHWKWTIEGRGSMLCDKVEAEYRLSRKIGSCSVSDDESASRSTVGSMCVKRNLPTRQSGWKKSNWNEVVCLVSFFVSCRSLTDRVKYFVSP